jgi:Sulfotransferase family
MIKEYIRARLGESRTESVESLPVRFIVSTGRTGTQFFESFFNNNFPDVLCLHEPRPDGFDIAIRKIRGKLGAQEIVNHLRSSRAGILSRLRKRNAKLYVESNPFFSLLIPELRKAFPTSRFLWIVRNPETYVISAYNKSPVGDNKMFFYAENDHRPRITAMDFADDRWSEDWPSFDRFQKICWYWNKCNEILARDFGNQDDFLLIKFEELFGEKNDFRSMFKMLEFFQISGPAGIDSDTFDIMMKRSINSSKRILLQSADSWTSKQKMDFDTLTYSMRKKLGY